MSTLDRVIDQRGRKLIARAAERGEEVPSPDNVDGSIQWLRGDGALDARELGRYLTEVWKERADLQEAYPGIFLDPEQRDEFRRWIRDFGALESGVPTSLLPPEPTASQLLETTQPAVSKGITCLAYHRAVLGVGAAGRRLANLLEASGENVHRRSFDHTTAPLTVPFHVDDCGGVRSPRFDVTVLAVNGSEVPLASRALGARALRDQYRIGFWAWELENFPDTQQVGFPYVDEVWMNSTFVRDAVRRVAPPDLPVHAVPFGVDLPVDEMGRPLDPLDPSSKDTVRRRLGLPTGHPLFGYMFDYASSIERKNPEMAITTFCRAFPKVGEASLVLKSVNAHLFGETQSQLQATIGTRIDVILIDQVLPSNDVYDFLRCLDGYVSLHRSEGYGMTLLEAMAFGVPTVATAYSGNLDFMGTANSWLIPYRLVPSRGITHYGNSVWAEPDQTKAIEALQEIAAGGRSVRERTSQARRDASRLCDVSAGAQWMADRLESIRSARPH